MSEFLRLDHDGTVIPEDAQARSRLAGLAGRYYLAPTSPDLLLGVRAPCTGGSAATPRVVLAGDLSGLPLTDLVGFLNQSRVTGILRVVSPSGERAIVFKTGEVRGAASDDPADRLGEIAVRLGHLQRAQLEQVLANKGASGNRIGRTLVEAGFLKPHDLWKCMQHQVSEIFHSILLTQEGVFMLVDQQVEERGTLSINTQGLLMDAMRRIDEMMEFRKRLPSSRAYLVPKKPATDLDEAERAVFELCNGARTVSDIAQAARLSEFDATKLLHHLIESGHIAASATPVGGQAEKGPPGIEEIARVFNSVFKEIHDEVSKIGVGVEFVAAANGALAGQAAKSPVLANLEFQPEGVLSETLLLQNAAALGVPTLEAAKNLHGALSELMFFLLFETGELLDPKADDELSRRVKELLSTIEA